MPRFLPSLVVVALGAAALTGCAADEPDTTSTPAPDAAAAGCVQPGAASDAIDVEGEFGETPTITFDTPVSADAIQRTVLVEGDGREIAVGDQVFVDIALYDGDTGEAVSVSDFDGVGLALPLIEGYVAQEFIDILSCATVGSRVVAVVPGADGAESSTNAVVLLDVLPLPTPAEWTEGVPAVDWSADGVPTITLPGPDAPTDLQLAVLEAGDGAVVEDGQDVTVNYMGVRWDTGEVFDQSFSTQPATFGTGDVVRGFGAALVGQQVGSTIIVVMPPELGYGLEPTQNGLGGQTMVFLVEILEAA